MNIVEIKELMGHASLTSTMVYQDVTDELKREAIKSRENNITQTIKKKWAMPTNLHWLLCSVLMWTEFFFSYPNS